jgi:hypothetical protein
MKVLQTTPPVINEWSIFATVLWPTGSERTEKCRRQTKRRMVRNIHCRLGCRRQRPVDMV